MIYLYVLLMLSPVVISILAHTHGGASCDPYAGCLALASDNQKQAFGKVISWEKLGCGAPARHCTVMALSSLGKHAEAAVKAMPD
ncbi:MAG: hypothetical protein ACKVK8_00570 [Rhodospirillales bacterium]